MCRDSTFECLRKLYLCLNRLKTMTIRSKIRTAVSRKGNPRPTVCTSQSGWRKLNVKTGGIKNPCPLKIIRGIKYRKLDHLVFIGP